MDIYIIIYSALKKCIFCVFNVLEKSCIYKWNLEKNAKVTERVRPFQAQTAAPSQIQPTGESVPSAGGGKGEKSGS